MIHCNLKRQFYCFDILNIPFMFHFLHKVSFPNYYKNVGQLCFKHSMSTFLFSPFQVKTESNTMKVGVNKDLWVKICTFWYNFLSSPFVYFLQSCSAFSVLNRPCKRCEVSFIFSLTQVDRFAFKCHQVCWCVKTFCLIINSTYNQITKLRCVYWILII